MSCFDVTLSRWRSLDGIVAGSPPSPRSNSAMASAGDMLYLFGGMVYVGGVRHQASSLVVVCLRSRTTLTLRMCDLSDSKRKNVADCLNDLYQFDPLSLQWTMLSR